MDGAIFLHRAAESVYPDLTERDYRSFIKAMRA